MLDAFFPEWDIRIDIQAALWAIPGVRLQYVAGHQDKTQPNHSLELLEQLKVDADRIASEDHDLLHQQRPYVVMSSHTKAHLVSADETVTSKHDDFLATQATVPPLITYLSDKYSWSTAVVETINGKAHGQALKRNKLRQSHYVKLVHDILPTTSQPNKYDGGKQTCPLCQHHQEDRDHILRCQHPSREEWRQTFLQALSEHCSRYTNTYPPIKQLIPLIMHRWLRGEDNPQVGTDQFPPDMSSIIRQQSRIGWRQLFQGHFAQAWSNT